MLSSPRSSVAQQASQSSATRSSATLSDKQLAEFAEAEQARIAAIARAKEATISVFAPRGDNGGSGVIIDPQGYAITNFHVVRPCGNFMRCSLPNGRLYDAVLVGIDPVGDVAMIQLIGDEPFPVATLADSDTVQVGQWCFAIGNPFLLATNFQPTVTFGIVSGVQRYQEPAGTLLEYTDCIQTDAAINPGNSGGPLFNARGQLIGINGRGSFEKRGRVNVGVGYAISINQVKNFLGCLQSGRILDHATLGATVAFDDRGRVIVSNLLTASDAYRRGLRVGDEVLRLGTREIRSVNDFKNVLGIYPRGWRVPLVFRREGEVFETVVRLSGVHSQQELVEMIQGPPVASQRPPPEESEPDIEEPRQEEPAEPEGESPDSDEDFPARVTQRMIERPGFANEFFNRRGRERVWRAIRPHAASELPVGEFDLTLQGTWNSAAPFRAALRGPQAGLEIDGAPELLEPDRPLADQLGPRGSNGLLLALQMWHRILNSTPEQFGDVNYYGTLPYDPGGPQLPMAIATYDTIECRAMIAPETERLTILEVFADVQSDPCVLRYADYRQTGALQLPYRIEVWTEESLYGVIEVEAYEVSPRDEDASR